jgi:outer membrane biogenesis lipoprotein LolB
VIRRVAGFLAAALVAACATAPAPQPFPQLSSVPADFEVLGRLAVRQGDRSDIAKLRWTRLARADTWTISSPLGNEVARIESGPRGATLVQAGAAPESAAGFAQLTQRLLGVALDPDVLAGWLHASVPTPVAGDWQVTIEETQRAGDVELARRITARRGDVVVRLVVDSYRALP